MIKLVKSIAILFILNHTMSQCGEGCLKCSTEKVCELCDTLNAFVLSEKECLYQPVENCKLYNLEGKCQSCISGNYLQ